MNVSYWSDSIFLSTLFYIYGILITGEVLDAGPEFEISTALFKNKLDPWEQYVCKGLCT